MSTPTFAERVTRRARLIRGVAIVAAVCASGVAVSQASYSAFSATTSNSSDAWSSGQLSLTNDKTSALFSVSKMVPGDTGSQVITVTSKGSVPGAVKVYATGGTSSTADGGLGSYVTLTVQEGTSTTTGFTPDKTGAASDGIVYSGTLADFIANKVSYATGFGAWSTTGASSESKSYKITYTLSTKAPDTVQGKTAGVNFVWEVQAGASS